MIKMNSKTFSQEIETAVKKEKLSYMDAIIHLCEEKDLDPGKVNSFINKQIKEKLTSQQTSMIFIAIVARSIVN